MKYKTIKIYIVILALVGITPLITAWGIFGHEHINRAAVFALPMPLQTFFYNHIDYITQESTVPDLRKYTIGDKTEGPKHFFDLENYVPNDSIPKTMAEAKKKYEEKFLQDNGTLYWYMQDMMEKLTKAFKSKKKTEILFLAADLGHYLGDAHMPLHCSANFDGQQTGQKGIHALWESRLPEMFGKDYNYSAVEAHLIEDIQKEIWRIIINSNQAADTVLLVDKMLRKKYGDDKIFKLDVEGKPVKNKYNSSIFSDDYAKEFHTELKRMVERRMKLAIVATANFWYTAWVNAGKPDLSDLDAPEMTERNSKNLADELKLWKQGKLFGVESEKE